MFVPFPRKTVIVSSLHDVESIGCIDCVPWDCLNEKNQQTCFLLVVVCFSRRIQGRFPALHQFAGSDSRFGFSPFISLSSSAVIRGKCRMNKTRRQAFSGVCASLKA